MSTATATERETFTLDARALPVLREKVAALAKRAAKLGLEPFAVEVLAVDERTERDEVTGLEETIRIVTVAFSGPTPVLEGWTFLASVERVGDTDEFVVRTAPDAPEAVRDHVVSPEHCGHCGTNRRRNATYVLRHDDGTFAQVGSTCLRDFLGHPNPMAAVWAFEASDFGALVDEVEREGGPRVRQSWSVENVLTLAAVVIRYDGWVSRANAEGWGRTATADMVAFLLTPPRTTRDRDDQAVYLRDVTEADVERAEAVREFILSDEFGGDSDYVQNLKALARADEVSARNVALVASAHACYARHAEREAERQATRPSAHVGTVGAKATVDVNLTSTRYVESHYGTSVLYTFTTALGETLKWFSSRDLNLSDGAAYRVTGTVKAHDEYRGQAQTVLTRCKVTPL